MPWSDQPLEVLRDFLAALAENRPGLAYALVAPSTRASRDPIAGAAANYKAFVAEVEKRPPAKFSSYELGEPRQEAKGRVRIRVRFRSDGDTDETVMVNEAGYWYVADPIHIIR